VPDSSVMIRSAHRAMLVWKQFTVAAMAEMGMPVAVEIALQKRQALSHPLQPAVTLTRPVANAGYCWGPFWPELLRHAPRHQEPSGQLCSVGSQLYDQPLHLYFYRA